MVLRWVERVLALLLVLVAPGYMLWINLQTHTSTSTTCLTTGCRSTIVTTSEWQVHPLEILAVLAVTLIVGLGIAGVIYGHSVALSPGYLITMWLLVPVLLGSVYFMAFTWMGEAAFFWGVFMLLAALTGSVAQMVGRFHRGRTGGSVSLPA